MFDHTGRLVLGLLDIYSDNPSLNPSVCYIIFICFELLKNDKRDIEKNRQSYDYTDKSRILKEVVVDVWTVKMPTFR